MALTQADLPALLDLLNQIDIRVQNRRKTAAAWTTSNEVLLDGEDGVETDTGKRKTGNGVDGWNALAYAPPLPVAPCLVYTTDTGSTADSDNGPGLTWWNNATQSSATKLFFDDATADTGTDLSAFFTELAASSTAGFVHMVDSDGSFKLYNWTGISDGTGYFKFTVSHLVSSGGNFADNITVRCAFYPIGIGEAPSDGNEYVRKNAAWSVATGGGGGGSVTLLGTATISGAAASQLTISGLSLSSYKSLFVTFALKNATGSASNISIYYNGDTTASNYAAEGVTSSGTTTTATRVSSGIVDSLPASETLTSEARIMNDFNGRPRARYTGNRDNAANITIRNAVHCWYSATNVTSITLHSSVANAIAIGSTISVYGFS